GKGQTARAGVAINGFEGGGIEEEEEEEEPGGGSASGLLSVSLLSDTSGTEESGSESAEGGSGESSGSSDDSWTADLSHIELAHSLMSHQQWRNWTTLMEAEIAVMQDLGYQIDRRNWYGHSVYGDGLTITNTNGFWARNAEGTAYLEGEANTATLGVGLHVYGSNNIITQAADLLACGLAGTGIRIEGAGNTLTVAEGVTVAADGTGGTGLMVSYGKNHTVVSNGAIRATGDSGIAVRFDFGGNMLGDAIEYRGSWMRTVYNSTTKETESVALRDSDGNAVTDGKYGLALNLDGPLVSRFAVSGSLEGSAAAIYIAANAYVEQMDILSGASITGNIVSNWNPVDSRVQYATLNAGHSNTELTTKLTFGLAATDQGIGGDTGDANFAMVYDGAIAGSSSLQIEVAGGALEYNGQASVLSVTVDEGASLSGTGSYTLSSISDGTKTVGGTFTNAGTYSPGSGLSAGDGAQAIAAARITGNYTQARTGTLVTSFNAAGTSDVLTVSGRASMDGTIALTPVRDYYANGDLGLALSDIVRAGTLSVSDSLGADILNASPTLTMALTTVSSSKDAEYTISMSRAADAYSQYAASGQQAELAASLDEFGQTDLTTASGDLGDARNLLSALDFSASDGTALPGAYKELGPDAYTKAGQASLALQRSLTGQIVNGRLLAPASGQASGASGRPARAMAAGDESAGTGLRVFATPMGGR
ncbi:MAG: autotransporter outer membrane beta-barrel domain-containing protein, partial [Desulfovibrionaceae bacterium]|nr:autotransporter outer membrane beta-barrel domain-containing protein [Desulfovibrionaceae bacterium]